MHNWTELLEALIRAGGNNLDRVTTDDLTCLNRLLRGTLKRTSAEFWDRVNRGEIKI